MSAISNLTKQEYIVLALVAQGKRNTDIAQELYLSVRTVESHLYSIFQKLMLSCRTEAAIYALQNGLSVKPELGKTIHDRERRAGTIRS
jgi:two-component system, NarL family, response regulator